MGIKTNIFLFLLIGHIASASIPSDTSLVSIFRTPESLFSSGEMFQEDLKKKRVNYAVKQWQQVRWKAQSFWIPEDRYLQSVELSKILKVTAETLILKSPYGFANVVTKIQVGDRIRALDYQDDWVQVYLEKKGKKTSTIGWLPLFFVEPVEEDRGYLYTRYNSYLFSLASGHSRVLAPISIATRLDPIEWQAEWVKVQVGKQIGYVPLNHVIGRIHFADQVRYKDKWYKADTSDFPQIQLKGAKASATVNLLNLSGYKIESEPKGMVLTDQLVGYKEPSFQSDKINLDGSIIASLSEMIQYRYQTWMMSMTSPHGPVWWSPIESAADTKQNEELSADYVLRRPIHALATHPKNENRSILSASGIFLTENGKQWTRIESFGTQNLPVAINSHGHIFVGDQWSQDKGKSFKPYIRWDKLTVQISRAINKNPESITIEALEPLAQGKAMTLRIQAGKKELTARGTPGSEDWTLVQ